MSAPGGSPRPSVFDWESGDPITSETCDAVKRLKPRDHRRLKQMLKVVCGNLPKGGRCQDGGRPLRWRGDPSNVLYCKGGEAYKHMVAQFAGEVLGDGPEEERKIRDEVLGGSSMLKGLNRVLEEGLGPEERREALLAREERRNLRKDTQDLSKQMSQILAFLAQQKEREDLKIEHEEMKREEAQRERKAAADAARGHFQTLNRSLNRISSSMKELSKGGLKLRTFTLLLEIVLGFGKLLFWDLFLGAAWRALYSVAGKIIYRIYGLIVLVLLIGFIYAEAGELNLMGHTIRLIVAMANRLFSLILTIPGISYFVRRAVYGLSILFQKMVAFMVGLFQAGSWEIASESASAVVSTMWNYTGGWFMAPSFKHKSKRKKEEDVESRKAI